MKNFYSNMVEGVGDLIQMGVWYSDACEVIMRFSNPSEHISSTIRAERISNSDWWDAFESDVEKYLHNKPIPTPTYKTIY